MKQINDYLLEFLKTIFVSTLIFLSPIAGLLALVGLVILADTVFAVYATIKNNGYQSYRSHKLFNIVIKSFFYLSTVLLGFLADKFIINTNLILGVELFISKAIAIFWIYIEVKSMDETSQKLGNKPLYEIVKNIINKGKEIKKDINDIV